MTTHIGPPGDPLKALREGVEDGSIQVWCYCDEFDSPMPDGPWVPPDDWHADVCCSDQVIAFGDPS